MIWKKTYLIFISLDINFPLKRTPFITINHRNILLKQSFFLFNMCIKFRTEFEERKIYIDVKKKTIKEIQ